MALFFHLLTTLVSSIFVLVESKVCTSLDVRNSPINIDDFRDCRIIEGHLQVVLMETAKDFTDYYNHSFAELREITDYLIVFRVMNLTSLDLIFPKLTTIGGNKLFFGYSLVVYELDELEEIGLINLRNIGNGGVKIHTCPRLCYVDTVDFIAMGASLLNYTRCSTCKDEACPPQCDGLCWNQVQCQNIERSNCHPLCFGCTKPDSPKHCTLCKYFNDTGTCVQKCPDSKLIDNDGSRCLSPQECFSNNRSIFNRTCIKRCPFWFMRNSTGYCVPSETNLCPGIRINNHFDLVQVMGCTHINGTLLIDLNGYVDMFFLEKTLRWLVSISEYLKITRSDSITSLSFFERLKTIKGEKLYSKYYSLFVTQNQNLQKLFKDNASIKIENGEAIFQENPHLCESEIKKINVTSNYSNSNGDPINCESHPLNVTVTKLTPKKVTVSWSVENTSTILGYAFYYTEGHINDSSLKLKDGFSLEDSSLDEIWQSRFVPNATITLKKLAPYTSYIYFIKTTFISEPQQKSPVYSFRTASGDPSEPVNFESEVLSDSAIMIKWKHPYHINGKLSHYGLAVYSQADYPPAVYERNYCLYPHQQYNCVCKEKDEVQVFYFGGTCIGDDDHYCNEKSIYSIASDDENSSIRKRSVENELNETNYSQVLVQELTINDTRPSGSFIMRDLNYFTIYNFFLKACNVIENNESDFCGGAEMTSQRTKKRQGVDDITKIDVKVDGQEVAVSWVEPPEPNSILVAYHVEYKKVNSSPTVLCRQSQEFQDDNLEVKILDLKPGQYLVRVWAVSLAGPGEASDWAFFEVFAETAADWTYGFLVLLATAIIILLGVVIWRRFKMAKSLDTYDLLLKMSEERSKFEEEDDEWKLDDETIEIIKELGQNSIGILYRKQK